MPPLAIQSTRAPPGVARSSGSSSLVSRNGPSTIVANVIS